MAKKKEIKRERPIPEHKIKLVDKLAKKIAESRTILIASIKCLPASQFQKIKKKLTGKAEVVMVKKSILLRAISKVNKKNISNIKEMIVADSCLMFSELDAFQLASELIDNQSAAKANIGDIAQEDIYIEAGPTDLLPGPAISELGSVGLKVVVENGKLSIKDGKVIVKAGEVIDNKIASVLGKLNILPMKVGFIPIGAYDSHEDKIYKEIKIDKKGTLEELRTAIRKARGFAINVGYITKETVIYFITKAAVEEKALAAKIKDAGGAEGSVGGAGENVQQDTREEA